MRVLRFSMVLTVFLFALLPALVGLVLGALFYAQYIFTHLFGAQADQPIEWQNATNTFLLTIMHGGVMYGALSLIIGIVAAFLLDKGMDHAKRLLFSVGAAGLTAIWADVTVGFTGSVTFIFTIALFSYYLAIMWWSVPIEQRTVPRIFAEKDAPHSSDDM